MLALGPSDFDADRLNKGGTVAVMFHATWCPFCRAFRPIFAAFEKGAPFELAEADISDEDNPFWESFKIKVVPTVLIFRDGLVIARKDGKLFRGLKDKDLEGLAAQVGRGGG